jgi:thioredoxin 1
MLIRDGVILYAQPGALPEAALEQLIPQARGSTRTRVRAGIAERSGSADVRNGSAGTAP